MKRRRAREDLISIRTRHAREVQLDIRAGIERHRIYVPGRFYRDHPRADQPWKIAEDRRLVRLHRRHAPKMRGLPLWATIARKLGRTTAAVQSRFNSLRAGVRLETANRRRRERP